MSNSDIKPFEERNQTDQARRKLKGLAKSSGMDLELITALANFTWDYDKVTPRDGNGWINKTPLNPAARKQLRLIADTVHLTPNFTLEYDQAAKDLIRTHAKLSSEIVWTNFYPAVANKNYGRVSEFASWYYLRGLNKSRMKSLDWKTKPVGMVEIARELFLKFFRGGSIERDNLDYLWCDLTLPLEYSYPKTSKVTPWLEPLLSAIEGLPPHSGLKDLLACCKGLVGGDKFFKQEVLQALSYADVLQVNDLSVTAMFIADRRDELSSHYYSNEWSFPLRFWSTNGGNVNREAVPET
ncbi:hypothetical protein F1728_14325 [Gimesia benthica]|uniref:Uncharacterized protein n=1 Tax=Gimesia benthica TaxID=2608982 RepID=A0A6I6ADZ3_9PLAN|nr:hypothetical protein [Gimesia benthica]QGQ23790.1 hypothetical protein F1728_14325 [Gimesia benthica]